MMER